MRDLEKRARREMEGLGPGDDIDGGLCAKRDDALVFAVRISVGEGGIIGANDEGDRERRKMGPNLCRLMRGGG